MSVAWPASSTAAQTGLWRDQELSRCFFKEPAERTEHQKIYVSTICPGGMNTTPLLILLNRSGNQISRWSVMNPECVAKIAIDKMLQNKEMIIPGTGTDCSYCSINFFPMSSRR